ncbi:MAG TPA: DUF484 family protein [Casimicrobiaceae bacterium]|nr:DUF484 family protein [Casimicrobiaceae bacterium]
MDASAVAEYLKQNPAFFEDYADVVAQIFVPHPHGGHAIPIAERQMLALRDKVFDLEQKLRELIRHGADNDLIGEKLHRSTLALFAAPDLETTLAVLSHSLREDFAVPQVAMRLWPAGAIDASLPELTETPREIREYADRLRAPYCGPEPAPQSQDWFGAQSTPQSFACLPLRTEKTFGMLALASDDPRRFHAGMGTVYLLRLAELASVAIARFLPKS